MYSVKSYKSQIFLSLSVFTEPHSVLFISTNSHAVENSQVKDNMYLGTVKKDLRNQSVSLKLWTSTIYPILTEPRPGWMEADRDCKGQVLY